MEWLSDFVIPSIWDVAPLAAVLGGGVVIGAVKKFTDAWGAPLLYGVTGGGVIFICLVLVSLSNRHMEELERIGGEQIEALQQAGDKQVKALEESSDEQIEALNALVQVNPTRPYFTQSQAHIYEVSPGVRYLTVSVQNNSIVADNVVSHLLVLQQSLNVNKGPLHTKRAEIANPVGPSGILSQHWGPIKVDRNTLPAFVVFQVRYTNALNNEPQSQAFYLKFAGVTHDGTFIQQLFNASGDEKSKIVRYMEKHGIATF